MHLGSLDNIMRKKPCGNIVIVLDYDALNKNKKNEGDRGKKNTDQDVPVMLIKVNVPLFKSCELNFSEVELVIKQELADGDNKKKDAEPTPKNKTKKKPIVNQVVKKPTKEGNMKRVIWIIDSGCSRNMTGDKALLSQFEEMAGPLVTFGDDNKGFTMGYGKLVLGNIVIDYVALVAGLKVKLLSVIQFTDKGFKVNFEKEDCSIISKKTGETSLKGIFDQKNHGKSPYSILSKRKPTVKHLNVFGSKCFVLKDNFEYVEKLDSKVFEAIFLGYLLERTAYRVYVLEQKKVMESTYVNFDDDKCPCLEYLYNNEAESLKFENLNIDSYSNDDVEINTVNRIEQEITDQVTHENENSNQERVSYEFVREEDGGSTSHANDENNSNQQDHTRKWDISHTRDAIIGDLNAGVRTISATTYE
ncbi:hypothetical protein AgCh_024964 [Apium graveolens]